VARLLDPTVEDPAEGGADTVVDPGGAKRRVPGLPRGTQLGRYMVIDQIGSGGMGVVYAAYDTELHRRVALKLLLPARGLGASASVGRARLLREAQAMARLSHPNVVHVYDVGSVDQYVFLALELVDGDNAARWLKTGARPWREVLRVFVAAGRGLAAAHAVGLVHRDFKPDNVLIGKDGRVLVTDFGLARADGEDAQVLEGGDVSDADGDSQPASRPTPLSMPLTHAGVVMGTPGYAAPEGLTGAVADARSDQFSFAASLWAALYRKRPFPATTFPAYRELLARGVPAPPEDSDVPAWLRRVVERGLAMAPGERFASLDEMLEALGRDPAARRRRYLAYAAGAALLAAAIGVTALAVRRDDRAQLCTGAERKLAGVWDGARRERVRAAFLATKRPFAETTFERVASRLDARAAAWAGMHTEACEATQLRGEQPEPVLVLRMACLDQRLHELGTLVDVLADADGGVVERAVQATSAMTPLDECANVARLSTAVAPPTDPVSRARIAEVRGQLARAKALGDAGKYKDGVATAERAVAAARVAGYRPALAEALELLGEIQSAAGDADAAATSLRAAARAADASRDDAVRALALAWLVGVVGYDLERAPEGLALADDARAALERLGPDARIEAQLESGLGRTYSVASDFARMLEHHQNALALRRRAFGEDDPLTANSHNNVAVAYHDLGRFPDAILEHQRALAIRRRALGPDHPMIAMSLNGLGSQQFELGDLPAALATFDQALALARRTLPETHTLTLAIVANRAGLLAELERYADARAAYDYLLPILRAQSPKHARTARALANFAALVLARTDHARDALPLADEAIALTAPATADHGLAIWARGAVLEALDRPSEALAAYRESIAIIEHAAGADSPQLVDSLTGIGRLEAKAHHLAAARAALTRGLAICDRAHLAGPWRQRIGDAFNFINQSSPTR
jgi:eukaryotic-like serine/threonine-protein kinase